MTDHEQIIAFSNDLDALVNRYRVEFDMTYAAVIGVLHMRAHTLCAEAEGMYDPEDEE